MGWLKEHRGQDGKKQFYAIYRDLQGRERSAGTFPSERAANKAWQDAESQQERGRVGDPKRGKQLSRTYVLEEWFPQHQIEASTREGYEYLLDRYILPEFGGMPMREILPSHVRAWVLRLQSEGTRPPTIRNSKIILGAILTTALNDQITFLHAGRGVKTPPVARKPRRIVTVKEFDRLYAALPDGTMRLLVETDIESGLRWGELTELRVKDLDQGTGIITVARVVVNLRSRKTPDDRRFLIKQYPKDGEWRQVKLADHIVAKLIQHIGDRQLGAEDLLFQMPDPTSARRRRPSTLPDPMTLGFTEPNDRGTRYRHGTLTAYQAGKCRCKHCRDRVAAYRAERRSVGKDSPRQPRAVRTDGHIPNDWFRNQVWCQAEKKANLGFHMTPHGMRHAHASWLLAGGADLQVVKERLGHGSIATTERYLHTLPGHHDAALSALASIRGDREGNAPTSISPPDAESSKVSPRAEINELKRMVAQLTTIVIQMDHSA